MLQFLCAEEDIANLVKLTSSTGNRLLFDVNLQLRYGQQWDPSNAIELFEFCSSQGFCDNIDWELGNGWLFKIDSLCVYDNMYFPEQKMRVLVHQMS